MVLRLAGSFISFGNIHFANTDFVKYFSRISYNHYLFMECYLNNYNFNFGIIMMAKVYYWTGFFNFPNYNCLASFTSYSMVDKTTLIMPISLEVFPLNIFTLGSSSFIIGFQNSLVVSIGWVELVPYYYTPNYFSNWNHFVARNYFDIYLDEAYNHLFIEKRFASGANYYNYGFKGFSNMCCCLTCRNRQPC